MSVNIDNVMIKCVHADAPIKIRIAKNEICPTCAINRVVELENKVAAYEAEKAVLTRQNEWPPRDKKLVDVICDLMHIGDDPNERNIVKNIFGTMKYEDLPINEASRVELLVKCLNEDDEGCFNWGLMKDETVAKKFIKIFNIGENVHERVVNIESCDSACICMDMKDFHRDGGRVELPYQRGLFYIYSINMATYIMKKIITETKSDIVINVVHNHRFLLGSLGESEYKFLFPN